MADENVPTDERVRRSASRTLGNGLLALILIAVIGGWGWLGVFTLEPGQAAVLLRLGKYLRTIDQAGLHFSLPPPLVTREVANVAEVRNEDFGFRGRESAETAHDELLEATMQTSDNNIVRVGFAVQFVIKDAFRARYRVADLESVVRDAAQAAMREVVGRETVDGVLRERRAAVSADARSLLQEVLDGYESGIKIENVQLQDVQPPAQVRAAFDDVVAATQDANRLVSEAEGFQNEALPKARADAAESIAQAQGYRDSKIAQATGEAQRFVAVLAEYQKAPEVTQKRLYLETMEEVLPDVEKVIVEPGTTQVLPYLPLGRRGVGVAQ